MPFFDAAHPLLSEDAVALEEDALAAQGVVAEQVLGLSGITLTDETLASQAACAVALQINYQVSLPPEAWAVKRDKTGPLETEYRDAMPPVFPPAELMADAVIVAAGLDGDSSSAASGWNFMGPRR